MIKKKHQTFNDGVVGLYHLKNKAASGEKPNAALSRFCVMHYENRTVGVKRFYDAKQVGEEISKVIRVPKFETLTSEDIIELPYQENVRGQQYKISQIQFPQDTDIPVMDISLERKDEAYDISTKD